jgi:hypothetical protein
MFKNLNEKKFMNEEDNLINKFNLKNPFMLKLKDKNNKKKNLNDINKNIKKDIRF